MNFTKTANFIIIPLSIFELFGSPALFFCLTRVDTGSLGFFYAKDCVQ